MNTFNSGLVRNPAEPNRRLSNTIMRCSGSVSRKIFRINSRVTFWLSIPNIFRFRLYPSTSASPSYNVCSAPFVKISERHIWALRLKRISANVFRTWLRSSLDRCFQLKQAYSSGAEIANGVMINVGIIRLSQDFIGSNLPEFKTTCKITLL